MANPPFRRDRFSEVENTVPFATGKFRKLKSEVLVEWIPPTVNQTPAINLGEKYARVCHVINYRLIFKEVKYVVLQSTRLKFCLFRLFTLIPKVDFS